MPVNPNTYAFRERVPDSGGLILEGTFTVFGREVEVEAGWAKCVEDFDVPNQVIRYECGPVELTFSRSDPVREAYYTMMVTVRSRETKCTEYAAGPDNKGRCLKATTDVVEKDVRRSGKLNGKRTS
jgi:hypothetical protein